MSREELASAPDLDESTDDADDGFDVMNTPCACCRRPTLSPDRDITLCVECANP